MFWGMLRMQAEMSGVLRDLTPIPSPKGEDAWLSMWRRRVVIAEMDHRLNIRKMN